ncbi:MAG TPA: 50S ribosomal protein L25/general stress protein Ctc [Stellaceae bacterium]|nr:50S ribosomal protein L25/general stress protein Ctc [Stellaceae bacterium]
MPEIMTLRAEPRARAGKGGARATRRRGRLPAILYGEGREPTPISLDPAELSRALQRTGFFASLVDVALDGAVERALPREVQYDPVTDRPVHVDLMRVAAHSRIKVTVPAVFTNQEASPGLRRGGILNIVRRGIELDCPVDRIPDRVVVDLAGLDIGDSVHISAVAVPEGCRPTITERDFTIATIAGTTGAREETQAAATAPAAPEEPPAG